jgi:hypothetical protein
MTGKTCDPIQRNGSRCGQGFREKRHRKNTIRNWGKSCERKCMDSVSVEKLHFIKGNCYIELKDYANAVLELQAAVRLQGASTESYRSLAIALANDGSWKRRSRSWIHCRKKALPPVTVIWLRQRSCLCKRTMIRHLRFTQKCSMRRRTRSS